MKKFVPLAIVFACFFFGCSSKKEEKEKMVISKTLGTIITDSIAPPKITRITEANAPKVIKAGPPKILPLSYPFGVGAPTITNYSVADGLSNNNIAASAIDRQGNIWFATLGGLSKYDGQGFTNYNSVNGMVSEFSRTLFIDSKNNVWIAADDGLSIFDGKYFNRVFPDQEKSLRISTYKIFEDSRGVIWIATNNGLYQYKDNVFTKYTTADGLAGNRVTFLIQDKNGDLLITTNEGLNRFDGKSFSPYTEIPYSKKSRGTHFLFCDSKGNIWFNDGIGVLGKYDGKQITMYNNKDRGMLVSSRSPIAILEDINGNLWFGGFGELTKFDGKQFFNYAPKANPEFTFQLRSLTEDAYGNIWAGTQEEGVYKISNPMLTKMEMPVAWARAVAIDKADHIWIRSQEGLGKFNSDHMALYWNEQLGSGPAALFIDHAGNKWFQSFDRDTQLGTLVRYNDTTFTIFGKAQWPSITSVRSIIEDDSNNIWFLGYNGVVAKFDGFSFAEFGPAQGLRAGGIFSIFQDSKRNIWFGSNDAGAFKFDGHHFVNYTTQDGLPHHFINSIAEDPFGNIWLGTDAGAAKFDGKTFTSYGEKQGLAKVVARLKYDSVNNAIWFDTHIGLASIKMEQVNVEKPIFQHYNSRTGFDFSIIRDITVDKQGIVWVLDNGVLRFDFKSIDNSKPTPLQIKNIKLNNEDISWSSLQQGAFPIETKDSLKAVNEMALKFGKAFSDEDFSVMSDAFGNVSYDSVAGSDFIPVNLVLPFKNNTIGFEFGSISASFGKAIQYQYRLEGYDKNWSELSTKTEASYGNLSEGNYTFYIKALNPLGSWSEVSYSFKVLPPWYRSWWAYGFYLILFVAGTFAFDRYQRKRLIQKEREKAREIELEQAKEIEKAYRNLEVAHKDLKAAQAQLIQSEKMASLGELTAGIAHEIQNPLNFVNNFSEVSVDLVEELDEEMEAGNKEEMKAITSDLKQNLSKISHHGKRASSIVKGMLQHSRTSTGQKEPTDINALADEYLRLSYHGLRAKDKSFNADFKTDFDESLPKINVIPQDIGRVLLNLINNAFYAVQTRHALSVQTPSPYKPTVTVSTRNLGDRIEISVKDNGNGIPPEIIDKIFQPFFTTKPSGQGTGLGLSLSYDIVKMHGGELRVESKKGEGSNFIIVLPT